MSIDQETKDWTWVLRQECSECGEDVGQLSLADAIERLRELQDPWRVELEQPGLATRPNDRTWSRLEYACHVRDALAVFRGRVALMLQRDEPTFRDRKSTRLNSSHVASSCAVFCLTKKLPSTGSGGHQRRERRAGDCPGTAKGAARR